MGILVNEQTKLIVQGIKPYTIANLPRIKAILSYLHTNPIWPFYAIGTPSKDGEINLEAVRNDSVVAMTATAKFD